MGFFNRNMEAKGRFAAILAVAFSDGEFSEEEKVAAMMLSVKYGLSKKDVKDVCENPGKFAGQLPKDRASRHDLLRDMAGMMVSDGEITEDEVNTIMMIAMAMGFTEEEFRSVLFTH